MKVNARLIQCGITEIEINKEAKFKALMKFQAEDNQSYYWEAFLHKKDGSKNDYCESQMKAVGFKGMDDAQSVVEFSSGVLDNFDTEKLFELEIESVKGNDGVIREKVKWVNDPDNPRQTLKQANTESLLKKLGLSASSVKSGGDDLPF